VQTQASPADLSAHHLPFAVKGDFRWPDIQAKELARVDASPFVRRPKSDWNDPLVFAAAGCDEESRPTHRRRNHQACLPGGRFSSHKLQPHNGIAGGLERRRQQPHKAFGIGAVVYK
jgi:hypothetical protein